MVKDPSSTEYTTEEISLETVLTDVLDHYDEVAAIVVYHDFIEDPSRLDIKVKTPDIAGLHESSSLYASSRYQAVVDTGTEQFSLPVHVTAQNDGPPASDSCEWTTVYRADTFPSLEPLALEDGLDRLCARIGKSRE